MKKIFQSTSGDGIGILYRTCCTHVLIVGDMNSKNFKLSSLALVFCRNDLQNHEELMYHDAEYLSWVVIFSKACHA